MSRKALVVIDMLCDFLEPDGRLYIGPTSKDVIGSVRLDL